MDDHYVYININNSTIYVTKLYKPIKYFKLLVQNIKHYVPIFSVDHGGPYSKPCNWILEVPIVGHHTLALLITTCQPFNLLKFTSCFFRFTNTYSIYLKN